MLASISPPPGRLDNRGLSYRANQENHVPEVLSVHCQSRNAAERGA